MPSSRCSNLEQRFVLPHFKTITPYRKSFFKMRQLRLQNLIRDFTTCIFSEKYELPNIDPRGESDNREQRNESSASAHQRSDTTSTTGEDKECVEIDNSLLYGVEDVPPWYTCLFLGFQHYLEMIGATVACPFFLTPALCMLEDDPNRANIISTLIFMSGIITLLQSTFGARLPIVQGGSFSYLIPALAIMSLPKWKCPAMDEIHSMSIEERTECWQVRMREIQGAIIVAALVETFLATFGIIGLVLRWLTPLTVAPAICLIGISLFRHAAKECAKNWPIALGTAILLIVTSQHLRYFKIGIPGRRQANKFPLFQVFPVLISLVTICVISAVLTATDVLEVGDAGRIDSKKNLLLNAPWFRIPYPFQWGWPTVSLGAVLGVMAGVFASMVESLGDYYACARISNVEVPPLHAMNRGIFVESLGCALSGVWGSGNGSTSYSNNIGTISITRVASRRVIQTAGCIMIGLSLVGKAGAIFVGLPDPIIGGMFCYIFPLIMAVGFHIVHDVDLTSARNIFIVSFAIFFGLMISEWMGENKGIFNTGSEDLNTIIEILLSTGMFIAGLLGCFLDNTIPGTPEERGLHHFSPSEILKGHNRGEGIETYNFPIGMSFWRKFKILRWFPLSPTFEKHPLTQLPCCRSPDN